MMMSRLLAKGRHGRRIGQVVMVALGAILLGCGADAMEGKGEIETARWTLRYLSVGEFLPVAADALARTLGGEAGNGRDKQDELKDGARARDLEALRVGSAVLVSDARTNAIIVAGDAKARELVQLLIKELDVAGLQVCVSVIIAEVRLDRAVKDALEPVRAIRSVKLGEAEVVVEPVIPPGDGAFATIALPETEGAPNDRAGEFLRAYGGELGAHPNVRVLSRPTVFTESGAKARISSGVAGVGKPMAEGKRERRVQSDQMAIELDVRPLVNSDREITLELESSVETTGDDKDAREVSSICTTVTLPDGGVVVLAGHSSEEGRALLLLAQATVIDTAEGDE